MNKYFTQSGVYEVRACVKNKDGSIYVEYDQRVASTPEELSSEMKSVKLSNMGEDTVSCEVTARFKYFYKDYRY